MQTKFLHKIKWYKPFLIFCVLVIHTLFINQLFAQQVIVNINPAPYNKLYMESLWDLTISYTPLDTIHEPLLVSLYGELLEEEVGLIVTGKTIPFQLHPGVRTFTGADYDELAPQITYISRDPRYEEGILRTGVFPYGDYTYCIYVRLVSNNETIGYNCMNQTIEKMAAPSLISPPDGDTLMNKIPVFNWMHAVTPGTDVFYKLKIIEIWDPRMNPEIAMQESHAWFEQDNIRTTVFQYPVPARELLDTIMYAWQVTSYGPTGEPIGENDGKSEIWIILPAPKVITDMLNPCNLLKVNFVKDTSNNLCLFDLTIQNKIPEKNRSEYDVKQLRINTGNIQIRNSWTKESGWKQSPDSISTAVNTITWTNVGSFPVNREIKLATLCFDYDKSFYVQYEWMDNNEQTICKDSLAIIKHEINYYYVLSKELLNNYIELSNDTLNIQFLNNYASADNITFSIYDVKTQEIVIVKTKKDIELNNINGLNRISIYLKNYNLQSDNLYLLSLSDFKSNYYLNFKVSGNYEK